MFLSDYLDTKQSTADDRSKDSRRSSRQMMGGTDQDQQQQGTGPRGATSVGMDGSVSQVSSVGGDNNSAFWDEKSAASSRGGDQFEVILEKDGGSRKRNILMVVTALIVASLFFVMVFFTTKKVQSNKAAAATPYASDDCQPGVVKDVKDPQLEIYITGLAREPTEDEKRQLETAVMHGYNEVAGGCADEYQRWMYNVDLVSAVAHNEVIMTDTTTRLENLFDDVTAYVARFETKISCDNCPDEEGFASLYPATFGADEIGPNNRRRTAEELNAAEIVVAIERAARYAMPNFGAFLEFSVLSQRQDGSAAATTLMRDATQDDQNDEFYNPEFFRKKAVKDAQEYRQEDCDGVREAYKRGKSNKSEKSSKSSQTTRVATATRTTGDGGCDCQCWSDMTCKCECEMASRQNGVNSKSTKEPKATKAPSVKATKTPSMKATKTPSMKATKTPSMKTTKTPSMKSSKAPSPAKTRCGTRRDLEVDVFEADVPEE
ncbi:MAG: hypothetical protein SGILL_005208 [Bacillariaceae sp.]